MTKRRAFLLSLAACGLAPTPLAAGEVRLRDGTVLEGTLYPLAGISEKQAAQALAGDDESRPSRVFPVELIDQGFRRYYVTRRQIESAETERDLPSRFEEFKLPNKPGRRALDVQTVGTVESVTPFSEFGRRTVKLRTDRPAPDLVQGVTRITPRWAELIGINADWNSGLGIAEIPQAELDAMLRTATDPKNPDDRLAVARFYVQAGMYLRAGLELQRIAAEFPELAAAVERIDAQLGPVWAQQILGDVLAARDAGQHDFARQAIARFPENRLTPATRVRLADLRDEYRANRERIDRALLRIDQFVAELPADRRAELAPFRTEVRDGLSWDTLDRLGPFLQFEADGARPAADRLAQAISGWLLGAAGATGNPDAALGAWRARGLLRSYLGTGDGLLARELAEQLAALEGVTVETVRALIPRLEPWHGHAPPTPGEVVTVTVPGGFAGEQVRYAAAVPPEYRPQRSYPLLVVLRNAGQSIEAAVERWDVARRRGYVVIAPEYLGERRTYAPGANAHEAVLSSLRDARARFGVDSDRVYVTGHGGGGDAAVDVGLSHPGVFAAASAFNGRFRKVSTLHSDAVDRVPLYLVTGEKDTPVLEANDGPVRGLMLRGRPVIYAEYQGRGVEPYGNEAAPLLDWFARHRRDPYPAETAAEVIRTSDVRDAWLRMEEVPRGVLTSALVGRGRIMTPELEGEIVDRDDVRVGCGGGGVTVWLSPELVDYDRRVTVRVNGRRRFNDFLKPELQPLLDDLKARGDRQRTFTTEMRF